MSSRSAYRGSALPFLKALKAIVLDNVFKLGQLDSMNLVMSRKLDKLRLAEIIQRSKN